MAEVVNETDAVVLFKFWGGGGGQLPETCERCNVCTIGTTFWDLVRHSFTIHTVRACFSMVDLCFVKHSDLICDVSSKRSIGLGGGGGVQDLTGCG